MNSPFEFESEFPAPACPCGCGGDTAQHEAFESGLAGEVWRGRRPLRGGMPRPAAPPRRLPARPRFGGPRVSRPGGIPGRRPPPSRLKGKRPLPPRLRPGFLRRRAIYLHGPYGFGPEPGPVAGTEHARWVQDCLNRIYGLQLPIDGMLDAAARSALRRLQQEEGLPVTGIVSPATEQALQRRCAEGAAPGGPAPEPPGQEPPGQEPPGQEPPGEEPQGEWRELAFEGLSAPPSRQSEFGDFEWEAFEDSEADPEASAYFSEEEEEFRVSRLPAKARAAFSQGALAWPVAVREAIKGGMKRLDDLTNLVFFMHHPERVKGGVGQPLGAGIGDEALRKEWNAFRTLVEPILKSAARTAALRFIKDFSGPAAECTAALTRAGKTRAEALAIIDARIGTAIAMLRKAAQALERGKRSSATIARFLKVFRVKPDFVPTWLKPTATIKDRGDVVAVRCKAVADMLDSGGLKYFCAINGTNCPDCAGSNPANFACSSFGKHRVVCLGTAFWDDMKAGNTSSLLATLMHEPFHIYFGVRVTAHDPDSGKFGEINCILQFVFETSGKTVPGRVKTRCSTVAPRKEIAGFGGGRSSGFLPETFAWPPESESEWEEEISRGSPDYIRWVQAALNRLLGLRLAVDGVSGSATRSAVRTFQQQKGLTADGIVGPATEAALVAAGAGSPPAGTALPSAPSAGAPDIVTVKGIQVARSFASRVSDLLAAAEADGIRLGGGGYRSSQQQIDLRKKNCCKPGTCTSHYDIYQKSAKLCDPPTAQPGLSNHEKGLAIDFTFAGQGINSHSNPGFQWLAKNAARFGLYNLASEPWHWSVDGR